MLQLDSVTCGYGRVSVVFDVSLQVPDAQMVAVLGNNGAGKTTLLRAVMGLLPVRTGTITFDGGTYRTSSLAAEVAKTMGAAKSG